VTDDPGRIHSTDRPVSSPALRTPSLRRRVTTTVLVLLAAMLLTLAVTTDLVLGNRLDASLRNRLLDRADVAAALVDQVSPQDLVRRLEGDGISVELKTSDGGFYTAGPLRSTAEAGSTAATPGRPGPKGPPGPLDQPGRVVRSGDLLQVTRPLSGGSTVRLLADAADVRRTLRDLRLILLVSALVLLGLGGLVLVPVIARALRPLEEITGVARSISRGNRGARLHPDRPDTELGRTATAFDDMLDTVEGAERRAVDSEERLRAFLSDASHDLRTPLSGIHAAAEHLLRADPSRAEREQVLVTLIREARRSTRLVDDMLLASQVDSGLELRLGPVDLARVAADVVNSRRLVSPGARLRLTGDPGSLTGDRDRIARALGNLVDNALHATRGTGTVDVTLDRRPVRADSPERAEVVVDVVDDGPGVPQQDRERIFERLVRLDEARSSQHGGAGLGLAIARGIARAHGGDLVCLPSPTGDGALFRLTLPVAPAAGPSATPEALPPPAERAAH
jgi:two-component system OmpR family sensor kinase